MQAQAKQKCTPEEYLALERAAETRSEYFNGEIFAMAGASERHNLLVANLGGLFYVNRQKSKCRHYVSDMRVKVQTSGLYTYPDLVLTCEKPIFDDGHSDTLLNPILLIEVLSPSTEDYDRGRKFENYRRIESLRECLFVAQKWPHVEHHFINDTGLWTMSETQNLDDFIELKSVPVTLALKDVYERVEFEGPTLRQV